MQAAIQKAIEDAKALAAELERLEALKVAQEIESATKIQSIARSRSAKIAVDNKKAEIDSVKAEDVIVSLSIDLIGRFLYFTLTKYFRLQFRRQ